MSELKPRQMTPDEAIVILQSSNTMLKSHIDEISAFVNEIPMGDSPYNDLDYCKREYEAVELATNVLRSAKPDNTGEYQGRFEAICQHYGIGQSDRYFLQSAVNALEEQDAQPAIEPLTLKDLSKYTKPIFITEDGSLPKWCLPYNNRINKKYLHFSNINGFTAYRADDYGKTWLAYRRQPERSDTDATR